MLLSFSLREYLDDHLECSPPFPFSDDDTSESDKDGWKRPQFGKKNHCFAAGPFPQIPHPFVSGVSPEGTVQHRPLP